MREAVGSISESVFMMLDIPKHVKERIVQQGELVFDPVGSPMKSEAIDLKQFCQTMTGAFDSVRAEIQQLSGKVSGEIQSIKDDVSGIHGRIDQMADEFDDIKKDVSDLRTKVERRSSGSSRSSSGSDKEKQHVVKSKITSPGQERFPDQMKQEDRKQAALDQLEESYEQARQLKQDRSNFEREYLAKSERCRSDIVQTDIDKRNLISQYKSYQGESKVRMLSLNEKTNAVVRKINQGATELKQKFGVTYPFESEVDEPEWTGLDLSLRQAHNPDRHLLDSPVPQILPRYHYPQSTPFPSKSAGQRPQSPPFPPKSVHYGQPLQLRGAPQDQPCDPQPKSMTQSRPPQSYSKKSRELYHPPAFRNTSQQENRDTIQPRQSVDHNQPQVVMPQLSPVKGDFETMMREVIKEELKKTMEPLGSANHSSRSARRRRNRSYKYSNSSNSTNSDDENSFRPNSRNNRTVAKFSRMQVPKMSFSGEGWRGFISQFETVADRCRWSEREKLDNFSMCLKKDAAEYYSVLPERNEMNFLEIKKRFEGFFDKTEPASAIRWDILNIEQREDEPLEKYLARLQGMIMRAYPGSSPSEQDNTLFVEVFLKGCREKGAVLAICDKKPTSLEEAYKFVQSASQYRRAVLGKKGQNKKVHFIQTADKSSNSNSDELDTTTEEKPLVRSIQNKSRPPTTKPQQEHSSVETEMRELKTLFGKMLNLLQNPPNQGYRSPPRNQGCFECGSPSHFVKQCPRRRGSPNSSPRRSRSPPSQSWRSREQDYRSPPPATSRQKLSPERANQEWKIGTPLQGQPGDSQVKFNLNY